MEIHPFQKFSANTWEVSRWIGRHLEDQVAEESDSKRELAMLSPEPRPSHSSGQQLWAGTAQKGRKGPFSSH